MKEAHWGAMLSIKDKLNSRLAHAAQSSVRCSCCSCMYGCTWREGGVHFDQSIPGANCYDFLHHIIGKRASIVGHAMVEGLVRSQRSASTLQYYYSYLFRLLYLVQLQEITTNRASMQLRPAYANCQQRLLPHRVAGKQFAVFVRRSLFLFLFCSTLFAFFYFILVFISFLVFVVVTPQAHEGGCW
jgi:hypothetical protein